jgi:hypothetical protein
VDNAEGSGPTRKQAIGFCAGVAAGAAFALATYLIARKVQPNSGLILVSVFLIPAAASALAVLVAGIRGKGSMGRATMMAASVVTTMLVGSALFFREGAICIAMAAPIFYPLSILGAIAVAALRGHCDSRTPPALVIVLPLLLLPIEQQSAYPTMHAAITTQIDIIAPLDTVWRDAVEIRGIRPSEQTWTPTHALLRVPRPVDAELIQRNGRLVRHATWQGGVQFSEIVTAWRRDRSVAWRFDIPKVTADRLLDEHLRLDQGYLRLEGGQYAFESLSPTRTRLRLTTRYSARTPWNAYAVLWSELVLGDIHRNVLNIVKRRAEQ